MQPRLSVVPHGNSRRLILVLDAGGSIAQSGAADQIPEQKYVNMILYRRAASRLRSRSDAPRGQAVRGIRQPANGRPFILQGRTGECLMPPRPGQHACTALRTVA